MDDLGKLIICVLFLPIVGSLTEKPDSIPGRLDGSKRRPQRISDTAITDMCPCIKTPGSNNCLMYNPSYQATSVEEAIVNFPDLTKRSFELPQTGSEREQGFGAHISAQRNYGQGFATQAGLCSGDSECKSCSAALFPRLLQNGLIENQSHLESIRNTIGVQYGLEKTELCSRFNVIRPQNDGGNLSGVQLQKQTLAIEAVGYNSTVSQLIEDLSLHGEENWRRNNAGLDSRSKRAMAMHKEAADSNQSSILGSRFTIGCVKRGDALDKNSNWGTLCNCCWAWRRLPKDYFPSFVNELICDKDDKCLSGWGICQDQKVLVDVLQNVGTAGKKDWKAISVQATMYCGCSVKIGSALHSFVSA